MIFLFPKILILSNQNFLFKLIKMSTAWKRLGIFFFFSQFFFLLRWKVNTWIAIMIELQAQGALTWKWGTDVYEWPRRPPFHDHSALLAVHKTPISPCFSSQFTQFGSLKSGQNSVHKATFCSEIQFRSPRFSSGQFTSPCVKPFGPLNHTQMKVECHPRGYNNLSVFILAQVFANFSKCTRSIW